MPLFSSQLSPNKVPENSGRGTLVGSLSTADPDRGQTFTYTLLDNAGGRFMLDKNSIKVTERILSGAILSMTKCAPANFYVTVNLPFMNRLMVYRSTAIGNFERALQHHFSSRFSKQGITR